MVEQTQLEVNALATFLGEDSPIVTLLASILEVSSTDTSIVSDYLTDSGLSDTNILPTSITEDTAITAYTTANGAFIDTELKDYINRMYLSVLGRSAEQEGLDYWLNDIQSGALAYTDLAQALEVGKREDDYLNFVPFAEGGIVISRHWDL